MAVEIAKTPGEERAARLAAETALEAERKRRIAAEEHLRKTVSDAKAALRKVRAGLQAQVDEARNLLHVLHTRILPNQIKPGWLDDSVWFALLALVRQAGPPPSGAAPQRTRSLPVVPRRTQ